MFEFQFCEHESLSDVREIWEESNFLSITAWGGEKINDKTSLMSQKTSPLISAVQIFIQVKKHIIDCRREISSKYWDNWKRPGGLTAMTVKEKEQLFLQFNNNCRINPWCDWSLIITKCTARLVVNFANLQDSQHDRERRLEVFCCSSQHHWSVTIGCMRYIISELSYWLTAPASGLYPDCWANIDNNKWHFI